MLSPAFSAPSRDAKKPRENPFKPPKDNDIFELRSREKEHRKMELQRQLGLKVHEKVTYAGRVKVKQANLRRILWDGQEEVEEKTRSELQGKESRAHLQILPAVRMAMIKDRNIDKESISEFIIKKREMFLLEYSLAVKYGEIAQLERVAAEEERKLMQAETLLENDAVMFDEFLKENDKNSVEAIKIAEQETKAKLERIAEIKRITTKMVAIKSDISKFEDILKEYTLYKDFLFKLSPPEWQETQRTKAKSTKIQSTTKSKDKEKANEKEKEKKTGRNIVSKGSFTSRDLSQLKDPKASSRQNRKSTSPSDKVTVSEQDSEGSAYEAQPELYYTDPQQLLDLLTELEEQNLSLIQNSRETEEALEDIRYTMDLTQKKMLHETEQLTKQIDIMNHTIQRERERATELELRSRLFNYGNYKSDDQEGLLDTLGRKVEEVYRSCVGDSEGNLSTLQMLTAIEGRLGELLENAEMIPRDRLLLAERAKDKERRLRLRDEKIREQKQHQEERLKRALERAQADIKKATGKKLMTRSQPPIHKPKKRQENPLTDKEMEEHLYFFT
ncbi:cilia- and flagella-associated protein 100 isoform X2 [Osmerus eperlanus]|uniref:cilia- and flagella-associated protein 100 isoform X2 n=1 Tax=Osmerus eperlanus TaxID=29151 RepID=UPI002E164A39